MTLRESAKISAEPQRLPNDDCCKIPVVLKKSFLRKIVEISGIQNVYQSGDRRLWGSLLQSFFDSFLLSEFFNSHSR